MDNMNTTVNKSEVAEFLATNPHFFEEHAELLGAIKLPSPLLGRAISLQERQMELMRDKYRHLELRLSELLHLAQENDSTVTKFQKWTNSLLQARRDVTLPRLLTDNLQTFFTLPHATVRLWHVAKEYEHAWFANPASDAIHLFTKSLQAPFCGENNDFEAAGWIDAPVNSLAMLPLRWHDGVYNEVMGLLVLGSPDKTRFTSQMSTQILTHIADTASAAFAYLRDPG